MEIEIPEGMEVQTSPKCKGVYKISPEVANDKVFQKLGNRASAGGAEVQPGCRPQSWQWRWQFSLRGKECRRMHQVMFGAQPGRGSQPCS